MTEKPPVVIEHEAKANEALAQLLTANLVVTGQQHVAQYRQKVHDLPPTEDPHILARRAYAMPLWNQGLTGTDILRRVNIWLETHGMKPVTLGTIRNDHNAIFADWEIDFEHTSAQNRASHIASLMRIKSTAIESFQEGGPKANVYLKIAMQAEMELARLDGSYKRAEVLAEQSATLEGATTIVRVYEGVDLNKV